MTNSNRVKIAGKVKLSYGESQDRLKRDKANKPDHSARDKRRNLYMQSSIVK